MLHMETMMNPTPDDRKISVETSKTNSAISSSVGSEAGGKCTPAKVACFRMSGQILELSFLGLGHVENLHPRSGPDLESLCGSHQLCRDVLLKARNCENELGKSAFKSILEMALEGTKDNMLRCLQGGGVMAQMMSFVFLDAEQWPFVSFDGCTEIDRNLSKMSTSTECSLIPLVHPEQVPDFENFAKQVHKDHNHLEFVG